MNPDEIAREMSPEAPEASAGAAGRVAIERRQQLFQAGQSFSIETTLSGRTLMGFVQTAREEGWKAGLIYFGLRTAEQAIERVAQRVAAGGHDIPADELRRRMREASPTFRVFSWSSNHVLFIDNSLRGNPRQLLELDEGRVIFRIQRLPGRLADNLPEEYLRISPRRR